MCRASTPAADDGTTLTAGHIFEGGNEHSLHVHLDWVKVSTHGPFALAYLTGDGQTSAIVLRGHGRRWRSLGAISDEGLRCGLVPPAVVADLRLERYNEGPKPCEP